MAEKGNYFKKKSQTISQKTESLFFVKKVQILKTLLIFFQKHKKKYSRR